MTQSSLELNRLSKSYGDFLAVRHIDISVADGEFVSFLGPSGSGKTTTLMMIAGFEAPSSGNIRIGGLPIEQFPPHKRNIGMVFQNYALFPNMTVASNIGFPLRMRNLSNDEISARVNKAIEMVGLTEFSHRYPKELSGGQQQRVALARALVFEPSIILLDEPLGALDKNLREQMQIELKRIHRDLAVTMIYVTHDQSEALTMSDRIAVFDEGRIQQIGRPNDLYWKPANRFVASFIGENNVFEGKVISPGNIKVADLGNVVVPNNDIAVSTRVTLALRPECINIEKKGRNKSSQDRTFKVESILNFGDSQLFVGRIRDTLVRVRTSRSKESSIVEGGEYKLSWASEDIHVMKK